MTVSAAPESTTAVLDRTAIRLFGISLPKELDELDGARAMRWRDKQAESETVMLPGRPPSLRRR